jgi:hypothetical protein
MKSTFIFLYLVLSGVSLNAQDFHFFDKKFRRIKEGAPSRYVADSPNPQKPSRVFDQSKGVQYAFGSINDADTLSFEGKVSFFDNDGVFKGYRFYKNGIEVPSIKINSKLQKITGPSNEYYMLVGDNGDFCVYQRYLSNLEFIRERIYATGKIMDTTTMKLDSVIVFYNENRVKTNMKIYDNGIEIPFLATTGDLKQPYEIIKIVTHSAVGYADAETELETFKLTCKLLGADAAIGIHTSISVTPVYDFETGSSSSKILIQGTAIKLKKRE